MATSWQYNTSANMSSYGSVTVMPHTPSLMGGTSNSQYGAWFGSATPSTPSTHSMLNRTNTVSSASGGSNSAISTFQQSRSPMRVLGNVPSDKYSAMKTNSVSAMMGHNLPDPKEKFSSLANKFGAGRILTPITSQYDLIMQEEEEKKPIKTESKTPIHSPDFMGHVTAVELTKFSPRENGYRKVTYKDELTDKEPPEASNDIVNNIKSSSSTSSVAFKPSFERSQTLIGVASQQQQHQQQHQTNSAHVPFSYSTRESVSYNNRDPLNLTSLKRANTFTNNDVTSSSRYSGNSMLSNINNKYPWKHEPHPPSQPATSSSSSPSSQGSSTLTLSDIQTSANTDNSRSGSLASGSKENLDSSPVSNGMYWLYGTRARAPPTPFRPSTYMHQKGDLDYVPSRSGSQFSSTSLLSSSHYHGSDLNDSYGSVKARESSPSVEGNPSSGLDLNISKSNTKKSILKKTSSYENSRGYDFPLFSEMSSVPRYGTTDRPLPPVSRPSPGTPIKVATPAKRVTFKLTPRTKEISPREDSAPDYLTMFTSFRFDPSLMDYTDA